MDHLTKSGTGILQKLIRLTHTTKSHMDTITKQRVTEEAITIYTPPEPVGFDFGTAYGRCVLRDTIRTIGEVMCKSVPLDDLKKVVEELGMKRIRAARSAIISLKSDFPSEEVYESKVQYYVRSEAEMIRLLGAMNEEGLEKRLMGEL